MEINKSILILLNELRSQISKKWKERGEILTKLWNAYFNTISNDNWDRIKAKNEIINLLLSELLNFKKIIENKNKSLSKDTQDIIALTNKVENLKEII